MKTTTIREATLDDAAEIANVHINAWKESYVGLIPADYLDNRHLEFKNRFELWKKITVNKKQKTFVAVSEEHGVVGFINGANGRDEGFKDHAEVWSFYLLKKYQGQKIGFTLLQKFFESQKELGYKKCYLWVLAGNPTISFYEKTGGKFTGKIQEDEIGGAKVFEHFYLWDSLNFA